MIPKTTPLKYAGSFFKFRLQNYCWFGLKYVFQDNMYLQQLHPFK